MDENAEGAHGDQETVEEPGALLPPPGFWGIEHWSFGVAAGVFTCESLSPAGKKLCFTHTSCVSTMSGGGGKLTGSVGGYSPSHWE